MATTYNIAKDQSYNYWNNKPVMRMTDKIYHSKQIKSLQIIKDTRLPDGYMWNTVQNTESREMDTVSDFLSRHYNRGCDSKYIVRYDQQRLAWEMGSDSYFFTVSDTENQIVGLVGWTQKTVQLYGDVIKMVEPCYMCSDNKYKGTGIAKVLMDRTIQESLIRGIECGIWCDNRIVPKPIGTLRQYSRPLNYKKLRESNFVEICGIDEEVVHAQSKINLRPTKQYVVAEKNDTNIQTVYDLYTKYMETFNLHLVLSPEDIARYFFDTRYVVTLLVNDESENPVDFISYNVYDIESRSAGSVDHHVIRTANILMYSSNAVRVDLLFINAMKQMSMDGVHIVYIVDMMHSNEIILSSVKGADQDTDDEEENATYDLNIVKTGKKSFINLFNWQCDTLKQNMISWLQF